MHFALLIGYGASAINPYLAIETLHDLKRRGLLPDDVSAAEIQAALEMAVPARSIDGVRKRTRATAGRCQGSVCMAGVTFMCSLAQNRAPGDVVVTAAGS